MHIHKVVELVENYSRNSVLFFFNSHINSHIFTRFFILFHTAVQQNWQRNSALYVYRNFYAHSATILRGKLN